MVIAFSVILLEKKMFEEYTGKYILTNDLKSSYNGIEDGPLSGGIHNGSTLLFNLNCVKNSLREKDSFHGIIR